MDTKNSDILLTAKDLGMTDTGYGWFGAEILTDAWDRYTHANDSWIHTHYRQ
jgi:hypothetical protein